LSHGVGGRCTLLGAVLWVCLVCRGGGLVVHTRFSQLPCGSTPSCVMP
jgi:hypothetical protein